MIQFRPFSSETDYPTLVEWWRRRGTPVMPEIVIPDGVVAHAGGVDVAMSFLYFHRGKIGVIELTTTNPACAFSKDLVAAWNGVYDRLYEIAREAGCKAIVSFVEPDSAEERILFKKGYVCSPDSKPHRMLAIPVIPKEVPCPSP